MEPSGIQQFMWGCTADGSPCIAALQSHVITLSYKDQLLTIERIIITRRESTKAKIEQRCAGPMLYGQWPDTMSRYVAVQMFIEISKKYLTQNACFQPYQRKDRLFGASFIQPEKNFHKVYAGPVHDS